jgi:hypothetical protein
MRNGDSGIKLDLLILCDEMGMSCIVCDSSRRREYLVR